MPNEGLIRYLWFFNTERLLVCSPKALAEVLVTNAYAFQKPQSVRMSIGRILGFGILLTEGDEHKMQRRNLLPAFAFRHIKDLYAVFWDKAREVTHAMTNACGPEGAANMEISQWASRCTLDIIGVAGLGRDFGAIRDENSDIVRTYQHLFMPSRQARILALVGTVVPVWLLNLLPLRRNEDVREAAKTIRALCRDLVLEKKAKLASKGETGVDILSVALESGHFSDENLVDQLMTFLAAGHETTATALTWAIYLLCKYPDVQTRLREEIRERLPSVDADTGVTSMDIDRMPYLNAVCSEVLRYYSPVPQTIREAAYDTTILGQPVPKGTRVLLSPWAVNLDPKMWGSDASEFNPDRWMPDSNSSAAALGPGAGAGVGEGSNSKRAASGGATSNYAFLTFLHGPRSCIGQSFAKAEFACLVAAWVGRFEFELQNKADLDEKNLDIKGGVTARPAKGLHVKVKVVGGY